MKPKFIAQSEGFDVIFSSALLPRKHDRQEFSVD